MRTLTPLIVLCVIACSQPAPAQQVTATQDAASSRSWVEPGGRYRVDFERFGWVQRTDQRPTSIVEMLPPQGWSTDAYCAIWESRRLPSSIPQADLNAAMERQTRETAISANIQSSDLSYWHDQVDGISTVDMRFHDQNSYQRWRLFRISTPTGASLINFVCGARLPTTADEEGELDAIVASLRFHQ